MVNKKGNNKKESKAVEALAARKGIQPEIEKEQEPQDTEETTRITEESLESTTGGPVAYYIKPPHNSDKEAMETRNLSSALRQRGIFSRTIVTSNGTRFSRVVGVDKETLLAIVPENFEIYTKVGPFNPGMFTNTRTGQMVKFDIS